VEDDGVLGAGGPRQLQHPRREPATGVVERAQDVRLAVPLIVPSIPKPQIHGEGVSHQIGASQSISQEEARART
jgi:hypothetical protein